MYAMTTWLSHHIPYLSIKLSRYIPYFRIEYLSQMTVQICHYISHMHIKYLSEMSTQIRHYISYIHIKYMSQISIQICHYIRILSARNTAICTVNGHRSDGVPVVIWYKQRWRFPCILHVAIFVANMYTNMPLYAICPHSNTYTHMYILIHADLGASQHRAFGWSGTK